MMISHLRLCSACPGNSEPLKMKDSFRFLVKFQLIVTFCRTGNRMKIPRTKSPIILLTFRMEVPYAPDGQSTVIGISANPMSIIIIATDC